MTSTSGIAPQIPLSALHFAGSGLKRPECVLATARGALYTADWRGGVAQTLPDGSQRLFTASLPDSRPLKPNGIALRPDGSFLLADLGETASPDLAMLSVALRELRNLL